MSRHSLVPICACASLLALLALPGPASGAAVVAPSLQAPAADAAAFTEGKSVTFEWSGSLQGDADSLNRSYFRLEIAAAQSVPAGDQSEWPDPDAYVVTKPGEAVNAAPLGVPAAGTYLWRVCAWGVADDLAANEISQLPGGCSSARELKSVAATPTKGTIGEVEIKTHTTTPGKVERVEVTKPAEPVEVAPPAPVDEPAPAAPAPVAEPPKPTTYTKVTKHDTAKNGSALALAPAGLDADTAAQRDGLSGSIRSSLGTTLPFVPIPFWTLVLLLACFPVANAWRKSVLGMFDWPDGSINGSGGLDDVLADLSSVPGARRLKIGSTTADADAAAPAHTNSAPDRGRAAA